MQALEQRITKDARHLGNGVIKVDSFINHQIDSELMQSIGEELANRFADLKPTKILTAEICGIAPSLAVGMVLKIPVVFARKHQPITMAPKPFREASVSPTHKNEIELLVSSEYLKPGDRVLIIDDILASAKTIIALAKLVKQSKATLIGVGIVIEKAYTNGRALLGELSVPVESLAIISGFEGEHVILHNK